MNKSLRHIFFLVFVLGYSNTILFAQSPQDCFGAIAVCQNSYTQSTSYTGSGNVNELGPNNQGCLTTGENNSVWYIINTTTAGSLTFDIIPNSASDDYDFAVYNLTDKSCQDILNGLPPMRCNYASLANSSAGGQTGLNLTSANASLGAAGPSYSSAISATAGQTYLILINNASSSTSGYTLNFGGTASVFDNTPPTIKADTLEAGCSNPSYLMLQLAENIRCNSLAANGSDFTLAPANATISNVVSQSCTQGAGFTNLIRINFSNPLPPGNYILTVVNGTDGNTLVDNCNNPMPANTTRSFVVQPPVKANVTIQPGCANIANGVITAAGQFGTSPYQYRLNNGSFTSYNVFSGLGIGTYTIRVRDANGCIDDTTVTLTAANPILINNLQVTNPLCFGQNSGSVTVTASGGNPPLQYAVNNQPYQISNTINGLGPGNYFVKVKDASGCIEDSVIFLSSPGQLSFNTISISSAVCGLNNGAIAASGFGGSQPFGYTLNNGPVQLTGNYTGLAAGSYSLRLTDSNGCFIDTVIQINQLGGVTVTALNIAQPSCTTNSGSVQITASNGGTPYVYSMNGGPGQASNTFSNLSSGTYNITVTDANGCTSTTIATLISPSNQFYSVATVVQPTCITLGSISVQGAGGIPPITYALNTGPYTASSTFGNLSPGTYTVHMKDANNCIHDTIITLAAIVVPSFGAITISQPSCSFPAGGSISVAVNGGTSPFSYVLNTNPPVVGNSFSNLSAGVYTITVTDANGCTITTSASLQQTNTLSFTQFTKSNVGCLGSPLGNIVAVASNGNPAYQYQLNGGAAQASGNFGNLSAGTYVVTVTDASGCTITSSTVISSSATLSIVSVNTTSSPCFTPGTGTISVVGTASNPPIQYTITPGGSNTTGNFTGLTGGSYQVRITDAAGCTVTSNVSLASPPAMYFTNVVVLRPPCYGGFGSISLMGAGGQSPYQYRINGGPFGAVSSWNNLPAGSYVIRLRDANGCFKDTTISLIDPPDLIISNTIVVNASCNSLPTGSATITASGGTPPYQYNINGGPFGPNNIFPNLVAGTYTITVRDSMNCTKSTTVNILANGNFKINAVTLTPPLCNGAANGAISFTVSGGVSPYQYSLNLGAYQIGNSFSGLAAGAYNLRAIDSSGCFDDTVVTLTQPAVLNFGTNTKTNPNCNGGGNGSVNLSAIGGTPPYSFSLNNSPFGANTVFNGLAAGTYLIAVRDANNCVFNSTVTISNPTSVSIANLSIINPGCLGGGGTISYSGSGGSGPYTFSIDGINYVSPGLFTGLPSGTYTIYVKDSKGCIADSTFNISGSAAVSISSLTFSKYICPGQVNGTISITASSANMPVLYNIIGTPQQVSGNFTGLNAGTYVVRSEDNLGCYIDTTITILQSPNTTIDSISITNATCSYLNNGSLTIFASGGVQPLRYQLGGSGYSLNPQYNNLPGGSNIAYVRDSAGCIVTNPVVIGSPTPIIVNNIVIQQPFCSSATDGQISISTSGGVPPYLYAINSSLYTTSNTFTNLIQGVYIVRIRDANNCQFDTTINLVSNNYMQFNNIVVQNVSCAGGNNGTISLSTSGGFAPYNYTINNISNGTSSSFGSLGSGQYTIQVTDNIGCQYDSTFTIIEPPNVLHVIQNYMIPNLCKGDSSGAISVAATGGTSPYQYSIDGNTFQTSGLFSNLFAGYYQIYVRDVNGCLNDSIFLVTEPDTSVQLQLVNITPNSCVGVNDGEITVRAKYGDQPYVFLLNGAVKGADTFYNNLVPGNYIVEVIDNIGCKSTGKYIVPASTISPIINIDSLKGPFCRGDADGYLQWSTNSPYPAYTYSFNGTNLGSTNSISNLGVGTYTISLLDAKGCRADTSINFVEAIPIKLSIQTTPADCQGVGDDGGARAIVTGGAAPFSFIWSSSIGVNTDSVYPVRYGDYFTIVQDDLGCTDTAKFTIEYEPCCLVVLPNAFTPNGDNLNDVFRLIGYGQIKLQSFEIFNRWGNRVFYTTILSDAWDGRYRNQLCEVGTYYYIVKYKCNFTGREEQKQGDVTLLK